MGATRREFLAAFAAAAGLGRSGLAGVRLGGIGPEPDLFLEWKEAAPGVRVAFGQGGNSMVVSGKGAALLVDCKNAPFGPVLRREAALPKGGGGAVTVVVNTHHHGDHTGGNHAFAADTPILAHAACRQRVLQQTARYISQVKEAIAGMGDAKGEAADRVRDDIRAMHSRLARIRAEEFAPTEAVGDGHELDVGGVKVILRHVGPGHTDNDLFVYLPEVNLIHAGDLLFHQRYPFIDLRGGAKTDGWIAAVREMISLCDADTVVVPGHGDLTHVEGLRGQIRFFELAREAVAKAIKEGRPRSEIVQMAVPGLEGYGQEHVRPVALGGLYDEMTGAGMQEPTERGPR